MSAFAVVICTRNRPDQLARTLDALDGQSWDRFDVAVVDQSTMADDALAARARRDPRLTVIPDKGVGLSRARNLAARTLSHQWLVYLDDDCLPAPDFAATTRAALDRATEAGAEMVSGHVDGGPSPGDDDYLEVSTFPVPVERVLSGRWTKPWTIGLGVLMALRRATIERLGGWDERLGAGTATGLGAAEDMDFNYRFLRSGGRALVTPTVRARHEQWRSPGELVPLYERYMRAWSAFAMKQLRTGDPAGGLWLWGLGAWDAIRMLASAGRRRSRLRLRVAGAKARGLVEGTARGLVLAW